jgi:tetratricopeptide (TPR) repeat protein
MNDPISAYFIFKIFTNRIFWVCCGITFLYGFIGQKLTPPAPAADPTICIEGACPNPKKAISILNQAISKNPETPGFYTSRGRTYCIMKQLSLCLSDFDKAIKLSPDNASIYEELGITFIRIDPVRSAKALDQAIKLYRQHGDTANEQSVRQTKIVYGL